MSEKEVFKKLTDLIASIDKRIDSKVNAGLLKHINLRWQAFSIIVTIVLTVSAIQAAAFFYVNDKTIKSGIETSLGEYKFTLYNVQGAVRENKNTLNNLEKSMKNLNESIARLQFKDQWGEYKKARKKAKKNLMSK